MSLHFGHDDTPTLNHSIDLINLCAAGICILLQASFRIIMLEEISLNLIKIVFSRLDA